MYVSFSWSIEAVQERRVQVVDLNTVFRHVVPVVVRLAVADSGFDPAAREPHREAPRVVVAAVVLVGEPALTIHRSPELTAPDHQRVFQQPAGLQVGEEGRGGAVGVAALRFDLLGQVDVLVPAAVIELHEPHVAFDQPAREQTVRGERPGLLRVCAVELERRFRLFGEVGQLRHALLHPERHLVLRVRVAISRRLFCFIG